MWFCNTVVLLTKIRFGKILRRFDGKYLDRISDDEGLNQFIASLSTEIAMNWVDNCCTIFFRLGEIDSGILLTQCWGPALISRCNPLIRGYLGKVAHLFAQISASGLHNARPGRHFWKSASCKQDQILCSIIDVSALSRQRLALFFTQNSLFSLVLVRKILL